MTATLADGSKQKSGVNAAALELGELSGWEVRAKPPELVAAEIHVWRVALESAANGLESLSAPLAPEERERAKRFRFALDRQRFVTGRSALRRLAATYLGRDAMRIEIETLPGGKPALRRRDGEMPLEFNVSHSGEIVAIAFAVGRKVGIDVEKIRGDLDWRDIAKRFFRAEEFEELGKAPGHEQQAEFFRIWTRKEALAKALGQGLAASLAGFAVAEADQKAASDAQGRESSVTQFKPATGYAGALAVEGAPCPCQLLAWGRD